jgi:plastocyanin
MKAKLNLRNLVPSMGTTMRCLLMCWATAFALSASAATNNVTIIDYQFIPSQLTITQNDTVLWKWASTNLAPHSTTSDDSRLWDSMPQNAGATFAITFTIGIAANYTYHCTVHPSIMTGSIQVQPAGPSAPVIVAQPQSTNVLVGQTASFSVVAGGNPAPSYQWAFNGTNIAGATDSSFTLSNAAVTNDGNYSVIVSNSQGTVTSSNALLTVIPTSLMTVTLNGNGTVRPNLNGRLLGVGLTYTMTATPAAGYLFSNWSGTITTNSEKITFQMQSNMVLQANFIPGAFVGTKGTYRGLFYETGGVALASSGAFMLTTTVKGTFSGNLQMASSRPSFSGHFDTNGAAEVTVRRPTGNLTVDLQVDLTGGSDKVVGTVSDGTFSAPLSGDRAVFNSKTNPAPQNGKYTLVIPANFTATNSPYGDSFGTVSVNTSGVLQFNGNLADGLKVSQASTVSGDGQWPLFAVLPGGKGSVLSWVTFAATPTNDLTGDVTWIRSPSTKSYSYGSPPPATIKPFSGGFMTEGTLTGFTYVRPATGTPVLNISQGDLVLAGGDLTSSITNDLTLSANNRVLNLSSNKMTLTFNLPTGTFRGTVADPNLPTKRIAVNGAVLQGANVGRGYFVGTTQSGTVLLEGK